MSHDLEPAQYGNGIHFKHCIWYKCSGCLPPWMFEAPLRDERPKLDLSIFRKVGDDAD